MLGTNIKIQPPLRSRYVDFGNSRQDIASVSGAIILESNTLGLIGATGNTGGIGVQGLQGVQGFRGVQGVQGVQGVIGSTGPAGYGGSLVYTAGVSTVSGQLDGWGNTLNFNQNSLYSSAIPFFSTLNSIYPWQNVILNVTDSTGQYVTIGVSSVILSAGVYTVTGGVIALNGVGTFSGTCYVSYYISTASNGSTGAQGLQGLRGLQGLQGVIGPAGTIGINGSTGAQGFQGTQGIQGIIGPTGLQGVQGLQGLSGLQGFQGLFGPTGLQGPLGQTGPAGGLIQMTQLLDNIQATGGIANGPATIANWTKTFTSYGGTTNFQVSFTSFSNSAGTRTFDILIDGVTAGSSTLYFNQANVHTTIPSNFSIESLSAGSHTFAIRIPSGNTVDTGDYGNASIIEVVGANTIGLTGPQGVGVIASFMRGSRNASQAGVVANTVIVFNQVDNSYSSDISLNISTGVITLAANKSYRIIGCVPDFSSANAARPSFAWYNRTTSTQIGSLAAAYNQSDNANFGTFGGISECIITPNVSTDIDFRCINASVAFTAGGNSDFSTVGSYPWFEIEVIAGNAPALMGATGPTGPVSTSLYANLGLSANVVGVGNGTDITWNSNISSTEITVSGTNITVPAGTYYIMGDINAFNFTDTTAGYLNVSLVRASDNSVISGTSQANPGPPTATYNYSVSSSIIGIVTFATSTIIKARIVNAVGTATLASANTRLLITSINI